MTSAVECTKWKSLAVHRQRSLNKVTVHRARDKPISKCSKRISRTRSHLDSSKLKEWPHQIIHCIRPMATVPGDEFAHMSSIVLQSDDLVSLNRISHRLLTGQE